MTALVDRDIDQAEVEGQLTTTESSGVDPPRRVVVIAGPSTFAWGARCYSGYVLEETPDERVIITLYKTSRLAKYLKRTLP